MSSKVLISKLPDPFQQQMNKIHQEIVSVDRPAILAMTSTEPVIRANQLERNITFLQEQYQIMLNGLQWEIESLKQKNRDLQFEIVFSKHVTSVQNTPSSDEESPKEITLSEVNVTNIQVELLERKLAELILNLSEAKTRNVLLQHVIHDQKETINNLEKEKSDLIAIGKKIGKENISKMKSESQDNNVEELHERLENADRLIRRLRRENEEQRKEIVCLRTSLNKNKTENRRNDGNNTHRNYYRNGQSQNSRFPPLHSHPHWKNSSDHQGNQNSDRGGNRSNNKDTDTGNRPQPSLPYLRDKNNSSTSTGYSNPAYNNYQGGNYKRNFYYHRKQDDHRGNGRLSRREQTQQQQQQQPDTER